ncbi:TTC6 isoform 9, partial [Pan troglodytes]
PKYSLAYFNAGNIYFHHRQFSQEESLGLAWSLSLDSFLRTGGATFSSGVNPLQTLHRRMSILSPLPPTCPRDEMDFTS